LPKKWTNLLVHVIADDDVQETRVHPCRKLQGFCVLSIEDMVKMLYLVRTRITQNYQE
jgi:hypothetical protein